MPSRRTRMIRALPVRRAWNHSPRPNATHCPSGDQLGWNAPAMPALNHRGVEAGGVGIEDAPPVGPVRVHDHDRGVLGLLGEDQLAVPRQRGEHVGVAVLPLRIPAVERLVLGPRLEVVLLVDHGLAVRRPDRRAQRGLKAGPARRVVEPFVRTALAVIGDFGRAQELREHLQPRPVVCSIRSPVATSTETICDTTLATRFGRRAPQVSSVVIS